MPFVNGNIIAYLFPKELHIRLIYDIIVCK